MTVGQKIKKLRSEKGLTQKDLADQLHVTFQTVSKWENDENEPDIATLRQLAKLFDCSLDYLLSEEESEIEKEDIDKPEPVILKEPEENAQVREIVRETIVIHQKELHVCARCKKDIEEGDLEIDHVCVRHGGRGRTAEYRDDYYHKACLAEVNKERAEKARIEKEYKTTRAKKLSFGWGIAGGAVALITSLLVFLLVPACQAAIHPALSVALSIIISYAIFADIYCIISGSYIGDVFVWCAGLSIRFPGLIFTWDIEGFAWLIVMKILFAILGFMIGVFALFFGVALSAALASISFPFVLVHNINNGYSDAL